jgi:hypothetical protein
LIYVRTDITTWKYLLLFIFFIDKHNDFSLISYQNVSQILQHTQNKGLLKPELCIICYFFHLFILYHLFTF